MKRTLLYSITLLALMAIVACGSERSIRKGDQYAAVNEYYEAARLYRKAYRKISPKDKSKRAEVAWKMGECYRKSNNAAHVQKI